jgi:hypothetical protein
MFSRSPPGCPALPFSAYRMIHRQYGGATIKTQSELMW